MSQHITDLTGDRNPSQHVTDAAGAGVWLVNWGSIAGHGMPRTRHHAVQSTLWRRKDQRIIYMALILNMGF